MNTLIEPTVGRILWYYVCQDQSEPLSAQIAKVNEDGTLNLCVLDPSGCPYARQNVALCQVNEDNPLDAPFCRWMPYQVGQAEKLKELTGKTPDEFATGTPHSDQPLKNNSGVPFGPRFWQSDG